MTRRATHARRAPRAALRGHAGECVSGAVAATGRVLCRLEEIEDGQGKGFNFGEGAEARAIFVVRDGAAVYGYVNSCPHLGTPLDWTADRFISEDSGLIMCATHGALFEIADGACVAGPCAGESLTPVPLGLDAHGRVVLAED